MDEKQVEGLDSFEASTVQTPATAVSRRVESGEGLPLSTGSKELPSQTSILSHYLYKRIVDHGWISTGDNNDSKSPFVPGLAIRSDSDSDDISVVPHDAFPSLGDICRRLDLAVVFTMQSETVDHFVGNLQDGEVEVSLKAHNITIPVVQSLVELATVDNTVRRRDFACLVREERLLLVWAQSADRLLTHASDLEDKLVASIFGRQFTAHGMPVGFNAQNDTFKRHSGHPFMTPTSEGSRVGHDSLIYTKEKTNVVVDSLSLKDSDFDVEESGGQSFPARHLILTQSIVVGIAFALVIISVAGGIRSVLGQIRLMGNAGLNRIAMLAIIPMTLTFCLFFFNIIVNSVFQVLGPIKDIRNGNSRFYSSVKPDRRNHPHIRWPHLTIQMPVYQEGLKGVLQPTIRSLMPAIAHYERLGGTASIIVAEDGMQVVSPELAALRRKFYAQHGIGWIARPGHGQDGFVRGGKFKKASNLNYALNFSLRVEDEVLRLMQVRADELGCSTEELDIEEEDAMYETALATVLESDEGRTIAEGNVRVGEIILLVDSDTRVPEDCLCQAAMEMEESPEVAIIQHTSGVLKVTDGWFEDCIGFFTHVVYLSIKYCVGNGDCAPFVGHNAFLRWKAMQAVRFKHRDGRELFWSEDHVSEDFDMALRLQTQGFSIRLATYHGNEFKEGVSLTIFDELLRWEKYSYGCSELLFHPIWQWPYKGPITPMVWRIFASDMKVSAKFTIFGYVFSYYPIACALPLTLGMWFYTGWFNDRYEIVTFQPWNTFIGVVFVFQLFAPISFSIYRHRVGDEVFWKALLQAWKWSPFFVVFFTGLSWHLLYALTAHIFCLPIEWSSTAKELEATGFFISFDRVLKTFKWAMLFASLMVANMIYLAYFAPEGWRITFASGITVPLATQVSGHLLLPIMCLFH